MSSVFCIAIHNLSTMTILTLIFAAALLLIAAPQRSLAGSASWAASPTNSNWNTATNWVPNTVPNSTTDIATFASSAQTQVGLSALTEIADIRFVLGADSFTISSSPGAPLKLSGSGIVNISGRLQTFACESDQFFTGAFLFYNSASAGDVTSFGGVGGGNFIFNDSSSAGSAAFDLGGGTVPSGIDFWDSSTAANATINDTQGEISFFDGSTAADAQISVSGPSFMELLGNARGGHVVATCFGGKTQGTNISFAENATAEEGTYTAVGASAPGEFGSFIMFLGNATADHATFVVNGGMAAGLEGTSLNFVDTSRAANANIIANGGVDGSKGGVISFQETSTGGAASITLNGNAKLDITAHAAPGITIGSLGGAGSVLLGQNTLTIGSNNQSTAFSGVIQGTGGVTKLGTGTLTLSGANTCTGATTVSAGVLNLTNKIGSGTGTGAVNVISGTLGGKGIIAGATTIGTGSGAGTFLAPAVGTKKQATLTIQSALTFNSDATYTCTFKAKKNKAKTDLVVANGVTINGGASVNLRGQTEGSLKQGLRLTLISNTSANPISGTFANLPDGGIVTINGNNFQASYEGGDGNDLTLTAVP